MKTKDGYEYKDGMTLYRECLGEVSTYPTKRLDPYPSSGEYAEGDPKLSVHIPSSYARKDAAYQDAINFWLKVMNQAREKLAALNKEHFEWLCPERRLSPTEKASIERAANVSATNAAVGIGIIPQTPIN